MKDRRKFVGDVGLLMLVKDVVAQPQSLPCYCKSCKLYWKIPSGHRYFIILQKEQLTLAQASNARNVACPECQETDSDKWSRQAKVTNAVASMPLSQSLTQMVGFMDEYGPPRS